MATVPPRLPQLTLAGWPAGAQGTLPVLNAEMVRKAVLAGLALNARVALESKFDRKQVGLGGHVWLPGCRDVQGGCHVLSASSHRATWSLLAAAREVCCTFCLGPAGSLPPHDTAWP